MIVIEPVALEVFKEAVKLPIPVELDTLAFPDVVCNCAELWGFGLIGAALLGGWPV